MKRLKQLWPAIVSWENLLRAYRNARRGKQDRIEVARFSFNLEYELRALQQDLQQGTYQPAGYRQFQIYERKPRIISVAPFRDRVLHHALMDVVEPRLDARLINDTYACRVDKGVHRAVDRFQQYAQRYPYLLKLDIASYFPSLNHAILKAKLARVIGDPDVLALFHRIIDSAPVPVAAPPVLNGDDLVDQMRPRGVPIGNLTSQFFGNFYLNDLDHLIKDEWGEPAYVRYMDDLVLFGDSKPHLWQRQQQIREFLRQERLQIHARKCWVQPSNVGTEFLGYRMWPHRRRLRSDNAYRFQRRLKAMAQAYREGKSSLGEIKSRIASWQGHANHCETRRLQAVIFRRQVFTRGNHPTTSGCSRGFLEQQPAEFAFCEPQQEQHR